MTMYHIEDRPSGTKQNAPLDAHAEGSTAVWMFKSEFEAPGIQAKIVVKSNYDHCLKTRFDVLAEWWHADTDALSSPRQIERHYAYKKIIELGRAALPLILMELRDNGGEWFAALEEITGWDAGLDDLGDFDAARASWLNWGRQKGLIE